MRSLTQNTPRRKHDSAKCTNAEMDTFLRAHPLPKELAHMEYYIRKLPVEQFLQFLSEASSANLPIEDICACIRSVAEFYSTDSHRCAACFGWSNKYCGVNILLDDKAYVITVCERCKRKIESSRDTPEMGVNVRSYLMELAK